MKKLLSILTLLMCFSSGVWADDVLCSAQVPTGQTGTFSNTEGLSQTNCTLYYSGLQGGSNAVTVDDVDYYKLGSNDAYVQLKLQEGSFQVGDVLIATVTSNGGSSAKTVNIKVKSHNSATVSVKGTETKNINYTLVAGDIESDGSIKIYRGSSNSSNLRVAVFSVTGIRKTVATQAYAGVKKGTTTLTENTDFTKVGNVITLASTHKTTAAPTDVKLINHKTFTDSSTEDEDVDVVFGATASEGYFTGTATIALTTYTVKVPHDATPSLVADKANITVTSAKIATGTAKIHLSGVNLAGTNVTLAFASTVAGLSIDKTSVAIAGGAVDTDVTVSYKSNVDVAEANVNLTISTTGVSDIVIPVTYSSTAAVTTIADVTKDTTWDFANAGTDNIASPDGNNNVPFANVDGFKSGFEYDKLSGKGQYFYYKDNKCYQGSQLKFRTTVSGNIVVEFSNTGSSSRPYRYLSVNGVVTEYKSKNTDKETTEAIKVPAGDVNIVGIMGSTSGDDCEPTEDENMLRIYKVTFTPDVVVTSAEWATTTTPNYPVSFDKSAKVYVVASAEGSIQLTPITEAPANTPVIVNATTGSYTMTPKSEAAAIATNLLRSKTANNETAVVGDYALGTWLDGSNTVVGFGKLNAAGVANMTDDKAFIPASLLANAVDFLPFVIGDEESETTSINSIENSELRIENYDYIYNLAGQKVSKDYKGIVVVNGKKFVRK